MRYFELFEDYSDLGKLSPEHLIKGQPLSEPDAFKEVPARVFHRALMRIMANDFARFNKGLPSKGLHTLSVYSPREYAGMRCFLGANNSSGFALNGDELVSVFSTQGASATALMNRAVQEGAKRLDCFAFLRDGKIEGPLYKLYSRFGFVIDTDMNSGDPNEPYSIENGVSHFVNDQDELVKDDRRHFYETRMMMDCSGVSDCLGAAAAAGAYFGCYLWMMYFAGLCIWMLLGAPRLPWDKSVDK